MVELFKLKRFSYADEINYAKRFNSVQVHLTAAQIQEPRLSYLSQIKEMVDVHKILSSLVINWDHVGVHILPTSNWILEEGSKEWNFMP